VPLTASQVRRGLILDHVRTVCDTRTVYSLPAGNITAEPLGLYLARPSSLSSAKRRELEGRRCDDLLVPDVEQHGLPSQPPPEEPSRQIFFKIAKFNPSRLKCVAVDAAAGQRLAATTIVGTVHSPPIADYPGGPTLLRTTPRAVHDGVSEDPLAVLSFAWDSDDIETDGRFQGWHISSGLRCSIQGLAEHMPPEAGHCCYHIVTAMVDQGAIEGVKLSSKCASYVPCDERQTLLIVCITPCPHTTGHHTAYTKRHPMILCD